MTLLLIVVNSHYQNCSFVVLTVILVVELTLTILFLGGACSDFCNLGWAGMALIVWLVLVM